LSGDKVDTTVRLIVTADDMGMTAGVTKGIVHTMRHGIVSSTSLMVNMPAASEAARAAVADRLDVGVHLNLTTGRPVSGPSAVSSLVRSDGSFYSHREFVQRLLCWRISIRHVEREFAAQVEAAQSMGLRPTHLDTHHHLHLWWPVASALVSVGRRYGIDKTRTTRTTDMALRVGNASARTRGWAKRRYKALTATLLRRWFRMPTWRMEPSAFRPAHGDNVRSRLDEWLFFLRELSKLPGPAVVEVPCHPAYVDKELEKYAKYVGGREEEILALTSSDLKAALRQADIGVIGFREL
jgi:chitin disaccharide deacetylase